jgi:hypothetical protein
VHLRDASVRLIERSFLELAEQWWRPATTGLTLLIDPGRNKRGVKSFVDIGPVFEAGRDAEERSLGTGFVKSFRVGPADRIGPDSARGTRTAPRPKPAARSSSRLGSRWITPSRRG